MDTRDILIGGAIIIGGVWWWRRSRNGTVPAAVATPTAVSGMTWSAATSTTTGPSAVGGIGIGQMASTALRAILRTPADYSSALFRSQAQTLVSAQNSPPLPPPAPNAYFRTTVSGPVVSGVGFNTMGPQPLRATR